MKHFIFYFILSIGIGISQAVNTRSECTYNKGEGSVGDICFCENEMIEIRHGSLSDPEVVNMPTNLKIGFVGDSGVNNNAKNVLEMLKNEGVEAIVHSGDLDYKDSSSSMESHINSVFSDSFPYLYAIGNHDLKDWKDYQKDNTERLKKVNGLYCRGNTGVKMYCIYKGLQIVISGIGTLCNNHEEYIENQISSLTPFVSETNCGHNTVDSESAGCGKNNGHDWKVCTWHKVVSDFQLGSKENEVSYDAYEICRKAGALIVTAHDHAYGRTYLMSKMSSTTKRIVTESSVNMPIQPGKTILWVNGLGGYSRYSQKSSRIDNSWWAAAFTRDSGSDYGAVICTFKVNGDPSRAECKFKTVTGVTLDSFSMVIANSCDCDENPICGNRIVERGEECDDGNNIDNDGCTNCKFDCKISCPECTKSWEPPISDGCGGICATNTCKADERCSATLGYKCTKDPTCIINCFYKLERGCVKEGEMQPTNRCGGTCEFPLCDTCEKTCPECTKPWEPDVLDGCGGICPTNVCGEHERCSATAGYVCVYDSSCADNCPKSECINENEQQPGNSCGGSCNLPLCD